MIDNTKIIAEKVAARMQGYTVANFPRSGSFNSVEFSKNYRGKRADFARKQREHEISGESFQGKTLLAEHHISEALTKIRHYLNKSYISGSESIFETDQDACRIINRLENSIFERLSPVFIVLDEADPIHTARSEYKALQDTFRTALSTIDINHPTGKGKYAKRLKEYQPATCEYLKGTGKLCEKILTEAFQRPNNDSLSLNT